MFVRILILVCLCFQPLLSIGKTPIIKKDKQPKRIIRMCCAFGTNIKVLGLPFIKLNKIVNVHNLGHHQYLKGSTENNGIIYTEFAGFIDIAHVRDQADWTAYLYHKLSKLPKGINQTLHLGQELGHKTISVKIPENISQEELIDIAGHMAYQLSIWHEIASWFGATKAPVLNEKFSSFSFEDNFSNGLGVHLGKQAILSPLNYNHAMDSLLSNYLNTVHASQDDCSTEEAMTTLAQSYWNPQKSISNKKLIAERNFNCSNTISPITFEHKSESNYTITLPNRTSNSTPFNKIYTLNFKAGYRFPLRKIYPNRNSRHITPKDFPVIIEYIKQKANKL